MQKLLISIAVASILLGSSSAVAASQLGLASATAGTIRGCVSILAVLRIVPDGVSCVTSTDPRRNETPISWTQSGPSGAIGNTGPSGPLGPIGPSGLVGTSGGPGSDGGPGNGGAGGAPGSPGAHGAPGDFTGTLARPHRNYSITLTHDQIVMPRPPGALPL